MKKLSKEEADKQGLINHGNSSKLRSHLTKLEIGEAIVINKATDWKSKTPPYRVVNYLSKTTALRFDAGPTADGKGWIVKRVG